MVSLAEAKTKAKELRKALRSLEALTRGGNAAERHRDRMAERSRESTAAVSDIGQCPEVVDPQRRAACELDPELFLQTYFPNSTGLSPFSDDHRRIIDRIGRCIRDDGRFINAVYRGFAKTTISTNMALWATLYGVRRYVVVFSSNEDQAKDLIASIKTELTENDLLMEDFPEVCHAFRSLEGKPQRCSSQTCMGYRTHIKFTADRVAMPYIAGSKAGGAIIASRGMTGSGTRGLLHTMPDGTKQRPDMVIIDDPQTAETAATPAQVKKRLDIIRRDIMKLAGHRRAMACVVNATVIAPDDLVLQLLDPKRNAAWQGERIKMVRQWADAHETLWMGTKDGYSGDCYAHIRNTFDHDNPADQQRAHQDANAFYLARREDMDAGCLVSWVSCYSENEHSAIQHAYNFLIDDGPEVFASECQNEPLSIAMADAGILSADEIARKVNGYERGMVPSDATHLTAFIDVSQKVLWWMVCGWTPEFTGYIVDYGAYPDQRRNYYTLAEVTKTLEELSKDGIEAQVREGLNRLTSQLLASEWKHDGGGTMKVGRCLIDANWSPSTDAVYQFCRQSEHAAVLIPTHGKGIGAKAAAMSSWQSKDGEVAGMNWRVRRTTERRAPIRHGIIDTNFWKSFVHARLFQGMGSRGCLSLFKADPVAHQMLADQLTAEKRQTMEAGGSGRRVEEWDLVNMNRDNHWLDCLVGCAVGASMLGASLKEHNTAAKRLAPHERPTAQQLRNRGR